MMPALCKDDKASRSSLTPARFLRTCLHEGAYAASTRVINNPDMRAIKVTAIILGYVYRITEVSEQSYFTLNICNIVVGGDAFDNPMLFIA